MSSLSNRLTDNVDGNEQCPYCERGEDPERTGGGRGKGWVELAGFMSIGGTMYDRGFAPCRWCQAGVAAFESYQKRHPYRVLETNYGEQDLLLPPVVRGERTVSAADYLASAKLDDDAIALLREMLHVRENVARETRLEEA